jgi:hypothetical protein
MTGEPSHPSPPHYWPSEPPNGYRGQLTTAFQTDLRDRREGLGLADCRFYHSTTLEGGDVVAGAWDLRTNEAAYLGNVPFARRRVLEIGPASGGLTFYMEHEGAEVTTFDVGFDCFPDVLPQPGIDTGQRRRELLAFIEEVQNAWWYLHRDRSSSVKAA